MRLEYDPQGDIAYVRLRLTAIGYDSFDQMLDIWIEANGTWRWKDWDELIEAEHVGIFTADEAEAIRAAGRRVIDNLDTLLPTGWESWRPDPPPTSWTGGLALLAPGPIAAGL